MGLMTGLIRDATHFPGDGYSYFRRRHLLIRAVVGYSLHPAHLILTIPLGVIGGAVTGAPVSPVFTAACFANSSPPQSSEELHSSMDGLVIETTLNNTLTPIGD